MCFLEFKGVGKNYGRNEVLFDISFSLMKGEIFGLVGNSGGGKSTLLKILIGIEKANSGKILFHGKNVLKNSAILRKTTGFAAQQDMLFRELTLKENATYFAKLYGMKRNSLERRFKELVKLLGLEDFENTEIRRFSGGMQKRANILVSLIHRPSFLILDEPTAGLDSLLREVLWKYIHKINKEGTTILVTSHLLDEVEKNCTRIGVLKQGKIVALASATQYKKHYKNKAFSEVFQNILENETL